MPDTPTTSVCALSIRDLPPPLPRAISTALGRPSNGFLDMRFQAILSSPIGDEFSHGRFAGAARHEVRIHRVDGDEIGEEGDEFVHCVWLSQVKCEAGFWRICAIRAIRIAGCANAESQYLC